MKKGINMWCFPNTLMLEQCFALAKEQGYDGIELNMSEKKNDDLSQNITLHMDSTEADWETIFNLSKKYDLPIFSIATALHWTYPLTDNSLEIREKGRSIVKKMLDAASYFGCDTVLVVPGIVTKEVSYQKAFERSLEAFLKLKEYAEMKKVMIGIENVWNKFLLSPIEMAHFIDTINSNFVKVYFDAGNVLQFSYPEHWVEVLGNRIAKVHVKDFDTSIGNIHGFKPLLQGDLDWKALISSLKNVGYDDFLTAELSQYKTNPIQLINDTARALEYIISLS